MLFYTLNHFVLCNPLYCYKVQIQSQTNLITFLYFTLIVESTVTRRIYRSYIILVHHKDTTMYLVKLYMVDF